MTASLLGRGFHNSHKGINVVPSYDRATSAWFPLAGSQLIDYSEPQSRRKTFPIVDEQQRL